MKKFYMALAAGLLSAASASALNLGGLQGVLDNITVGPVAGSSSVDATTDAIPEGYEAYWSIGGSGGSLATVVIELGAFADQLKFGIYDPTDISRKVQVFDGAATTGTQAVISILADGSVKLNFADTGVDFQLGNMFGFYLDSPEGVFYSDAAYNGDGIDHMLAYAGKNTDTIQIPGLAPGVWSSNEYALAWEDQANGGDLDFNDFVAIVESVNPVSDGGMTLALLGTGLCGVGLFGRRRS